MYVLKNRFTIAVRIIALAVVCLFTVNTIAWSYPSDRPYSSDRTLAAQSIFKPISDEGITISARMQFEIVAGAMLLASGKTPAAANAYLTEAYRRSSDNGSRAVEFLSLHSSGGGLPAKFKVIGRNDLIFEVDFIRQDGGAVVVRRVPSPDYIGHGSDAVTGHDNPSEDSIAGILKMVSEEIARIKQTSPGRPILLLIDGPHIGKTTLAKAIMDGELADYGVSDPEAFNPEEILHISGDTFHGLHQDFAVSGPGYAAYHLLDYLEAMKKDAEDGLIKPRGSYNEYLAYYIGKNLPRIMAEGKKKVVLWDEANSFGYFLTTKALFPALDTPVTVIGVYLRKGGNGTDVSGLRARFQMWDWGDVESSSEPETIRKSGKEKDAEMTLVKSAALDKGQGSGGKGQAVDNGVEARAAAVKIIGGTAQKRKRVRDMLERVFRLVPAEHAVLLDTIYIKNFKEESIVKRAFLYNAGASAFGNSMTVYHTEQFDNELLMGAIAHELGHIVSRKSHGSLKVWATKLRMPLLLFFDIVAGLWLNIGILTTFSCALIILGWTMISILIKSPVSFYMIILTPILSLPHIISDLKEMWWMRNQTFVTDYASTNVREDFAETYRRYALHRNEFLKDTKDDASLRARYEAMQEIFGDKDETFTNTPSRSANIRKAELRDRVEHAAALSEGSIYLRPALAKSADVLYEISEGRSAWPEYDGWRQVKWHDYTHAADVALKTIEAMKNVRREYPEIPAASVLIAAIGCMYHDVGYYMSDEEFGTAGIDHEKRSIEFVRKNHAALGLTEEDAELAALVISATQFSFNPSDLDGMETEARSKGYWKHLGAIYGARILGTLDLYDTRDEMMRDPVKVVGALREEYQRDLDRLDDFIKVSEGSDVDQAKMDKAAANLTRLKAITMPTDEAQFTATKGFYENVADKRVEAFGVWDRFIPPVVRDAFDGFRESHFGPAKTPSQAAGIYGIDMPNEDAGYYILAQILKMRAEGIIDLYGRTAEERHSKLIDSLDRENSAVYRDEDSGMTFIKIDGLLKNTGQAGHIGFGRSYGRTVVYIDKFIADNNPHNSARMVEGHELKEIELWKKRLGRVLGVEIKSLAGINVRRWMRENMGAAVRISRQCHKEANKGKFNIDKVITKLRKTHRVDGIEEIESLVRSRRWGRGIGSRDPPLKEKEMAELFKEMWGITAASPKDKLSEGLKTARHSIYVARLASIIAGRLALHKRFDLSEIPNLQIAAELHDLGKLSVWSLTSSGELFDDATRSLVTENHIKEITKLWGAIISGLRKRGITISGRSEKAIRDAIEKHHEDRISGRQNPIGAVLNVSDRFLGRIDGGRAHKRLEDDLPSLIKNTERIWKGEIGKNNGIYDKPIKAVLHMVQEYDPMVIGIINDVAFPDEDDGLFFQTPSAAAGDDPSIVDHSSAGSTFHEEGPLNIDNTRDKSIWRRAWDKLMGFPHDQLEKMPISRGNSILKNRALGIFTGFSCFVAIFITYVTWTLIFGHAASANVIGSFKISYLLTPFLIHLMPIVALVEETVFRGMLYESLSKRIKAPLVANILQAVIFSSAHYMPLIAPAVVQYVLLSPARPLWAILPLTIVGFIYGMLYKKGGIAASFWAHLTFNVISLSIPLGFGLFSMAVNIHTRVDLELFIAFLAYTIGFYNLFIDNLLKEDKKLSIINTRQDKKAMKMGGGQDYGTIERVALKASVEDLLQAARGMKEDGLEGQIGIIREVLRKRDPMMFHDFNIKWLNQALDGWGAERDLQGLYRMKREFNLSTVHSQLLVDEEGIGMLILGDKRIGKSRISIELLERDKELRLGADDAVLLTVIDGDVYAAAVPLLDSHIISTRLEDDPGKGHKKGIYNIGKSRLSEGFVRVSRILDLSTENIADIRIKLKEAGSVSIADMLRKRQWPDDSVLGPVLPDDIPSADIAVWDVVLPIRKEGRFKNIEAISEAIRGEEMGEEGAISNEPDKGSAAPGEGGEKSIVHSPQSTVKEKKIASAPAESSNDPKMDGASGVRPQDGAQSALSDIFKEFKGSMYYPAAGNDFGFLLWSAHAFPGVAEYVFRDSLDQNEAGAYRPDKNDIKAVAEWVEGWVRQDLGDEVESMNRDIDVEIEDDKTVNIRVRFDKTSFYQGREITIRYEIGDLFKNNSQYPAVYIQEPGLFGRFSEHKSFWQHIENNTADGGLILASQWATGHAQLANSSYIGTTEDRVMADILVYRKNGKPAPTRGENDKRLTINDERTLLIDASRVLKGYLINMPIDISLIPRDGEAEGQLEENMATLARLMAWHHKKFGLDIHYSLMDKDEAYVEKALELLNEKLNQLNNIPGIDLDVDAMLTPHKGDNVIEVPLMDMEALWAMKDMPENMYPVALLKDREGEGYNLPNYTAAAAIGLSMAGLRVASQKDTEIEYKSKRKEAFRTMTGIYERYGVDTKEFTEDALDILVNAKKNFSAESRRELIISLKLALPSIIKAAIDKLHECHQALQLLLQSA